MYKLKNGQIIRISDGACLATSSRNSDQYNQDDFDYLDWVNEGNEAVEDAVTSDQLNQKKISDLISSVSLESTTRQFCGAIMDLVAKKNKEKSLTAEQKDAMMANGSIQLIMTMLQAGRPQKARDLIFTYIPDETLITTEDKTEILDLMDTFISLMPSEGA